MRQYEDGLRNRFRSSYDDLSGFEFQAVTQEPRRNYFCSQIIDLLRYGLAPVIATADFPQETFLKAAAVVSEAPWASGPWPTACSNKGGVCSSTSSVGKTTLADILIDLTVSDEGDVLLDVVPLQEIDLNSWYQLIGYVPQEPVLFYDSIYANIALGDTSHYGK